MILVLCIQQAKNASTCRFFLIKALISCRMHVVTKEDNWAKKFLGPEITSLPLSTTHDKEKWCLDEAFMPCTVSTVCVVKIFHYLIKDYFINYQCRLEISLRISGIFVELYPFKSWNIFMTQTVEKAMNHYNDPWKCMRGQNLGKLSPEAVDVNGIKAQLRHQRHHLSFSCVDSLV